MNAFNIKRGSTSHSAYDLRDPNALVVGIIRFRARGVEMV